MTVLIVDNNQRIRALLKSVLHDLASDITETSGVDAAMEVYAGKKPDWVLMDMEMKPMDGLTATRGMLARFPLARIVLLSRHDDPDLHAAGIQAGAFGCVPKDDLIQLRQMLSH